MPGLPLPDHGRRSLLLPAALVLLGAGLFLAHAAHNLRYSQLLLELPLSFESGSSASGRFTAELDEVHELELSLRWSALSEEELALAAKVGDTQGLGVSWHVIEGVDVVARGDSKHFHYVTPWVDLETRLFRKTLLLDRLQELREPRLSRGIGRFRARRGGRYEVRVGLHSPARRFEPAAPVLRVRLARRFWTPYSRRWIGFAYTGVAFALAGGVLFAWRAARGLFRARTSRS